MKESIHGKCAQLSSEALMQLQESKVGNVYSAVRKLELCARLINDKNLLKWCNYHLGAYSNKLPHPQETVDQEYANKVVTEIVKLKIPVDEQEIITRLGESGGGFSSIEFVENTLARLSKEKKGNDGTHYRSNLQRTINACANAAYKNASRLFSTYSFGEIPRRHFDIIRERVDDLLLDICPEAIEKFMTAYERLGSSSSEDWSLALTATRRVIKAVADTLFPPRKTKPGERKLGEEQYINRLWAFLDENLEHGSDKDLAKAHVDYLGSFLQRLNEKASKGVHAKVTYEEAVRSVLYTYLTLGDVLEFSGKGVEIALKDRGKVNLNTASIDELIELDGLNTILAKSIIKKRSKRPFQSLDELLQFKGVGPKTLEKIRKSCVVLNA